MSVLKRQELKRSKSCVFQAFFASPLLSVMRLFQLVEIQPDDPMDMGRSSLLELHLVAVELHIHWIAPTQKNLGDESLHSVVKVPIIRIQM